MSRTALILTCSDGSDARRMWAPQTGNLGRGAGTSRPRLRVPSKELRMRRIKMQLRDAELDPIRLKEPPRRICLIRLSAIGDTCNSVPLIRTLQRAWPGVQITWLIGRVEAKLLSLMPEIEFLTLDKRIFVSEFLRLRTQLAAREFDLLLIIHVSFRANLLCTLVRAPIKLGFDRARSRDLQWLFTNRRIQARRREHVLESFWGFSDALGISERRLEWNIPLPAEAIDYAKRLIPDAQPTLLISPCSSHSLRNWRAEYYAPLRHARRALRRSDPDRARHGCPHRRPCQAAADRQHRPRHAASNACARQRGNAVGRAGYRTRAHGDRRGHARDRSLRADQPGAQRPLQEPQRVREPLSRCGAKNPRSRARRTAVVGQDRAARSHGSD